MSSESKALKPEEQILVGVQRTLGAVPGVMSGARGMSHFGEHSLGWLAIAAVGVAAAPDRRAEWITAGVGAFGAHAASVVLKRIVRRRRPNNPRIAVGVGTPSKLSFPSSHATSTTAAAILIGRAAGLPPAALPAILVPPMLASRLVLGVHYPTDVIGGAVLGAASAELARRSERLWDK